MTLAELIAALEAMPQEAMLGEGFGRPHSYRGYYEDLAFEPAANVSVASMLAAAQGALGKTFTGYKGGSYTMDSFTTVWLSEYGSSGEPLSPLALRGMLSTRALADAAGEAAPVPPPVEGLETTCIACGAAWPNPDCGHRKNAEYERRQAPCAPDVEDWRARAEAAEAKLAVYEAPIGDGEVEEAITILDRLLPWFTPASVPIWTVMEERREKRKKIVGLIRRLSAAHAECKGENTKLREALTKLANGREVRQPDGSTEMVDLEDAAGVARAALAPASGEKAT